MPDTVFSWGSRAASAADSEDAGGAAADERPDGAAQRGTHRRTGTPAADASGDAAEREDGVSE